MSLRLLSWNILMGGACQAHRLTAICDMIESLGLPDVICLQEVAHWSLDLFWKAPWGQEYICSREAGRHRSAIDADYFTLIFLKRSSFDSIGSFTLKTFPNSVMGRGLLSVQAQSQGSDFGFATFHMESPIGGNNPLRPFFRESRKMQAEQSCILLEKHNSGEIITAGDANWIDEDMGPCILPDSWSDPWAMLKPEDKGYTYDSLRNRMIPPNGYRSRLDRVWCRLKEWKAVDIEMVGMARIPGIIAADYKAFGQSKPILPSDHFGLLVKFEKQS